MIPAAIAVACLTSVLPATVSINRKFPCGVQQLRTVLLRDLPCAAFEAVCQRPPFGLLVIIWDWPNVHCAAGVKEYVRAYPEIGVP